MVKYKQYVLYLDQKSKMATKKVLHFPMKNSENILFITLTKIPLKINGKPQMASYSLYLTL
jgi:hypothetical protein